MTNDDQPLPLGPYYCSRTGLSYVAFGELLQSVREFGPDRYPVLGKDKPFHLVLYRDNSWRISSPQLPLFEEEKAT